MKIAVVYNRESKNVINLFGIPNQERYGKKSIQRIVNGLKKFGHTVKAFEGDKDLIRNLEEFMPRVLKGEIPGMVFNLSYGIQGQARYTHVPGILEMVGIPYVGSNPLAHSLALDKVVAKMIFRQQELPTPDFAVLYPPDFDPPDIPYPLIVKPKNEAVSMGIEIVHNEGELRKASQNIYDHFQQPVLVEQYIEGREINVGLLGNSPPVALPPCEIIFGKGGPQIYTIKDKKGTSGREIEWLCPAPLGDELTKRAQDTALRAFRALECYDCARVDMRLDADGNIYILEINSLPSLGEHGSYVIAAESIGLDFPELLNRLVETASARYFGTPKPSISPAKDSDLETLISSFLSRQRDQIEKEIREWVAVSSRTYDPVGNLNAVERIGKKIEKLKMRPVSESTDKRSVWTWETKAGMEKGILFIVNIDVPLESNVPNQLFRRDPEWLYGEGIALSRTPLVMLEFALRALRHHRRLHKLPLGVLFYLDEGRDCRYSEQIIREAAGRARRVFVLGPGAADGRIVIQRRGVRKFLLTVEGEPRRLGQHRKSPEVLLWVCERLQEAAKLSSRKERIALSASALDTESFPTLLPHRIAVTLTLSYLEPKAADEVERKIMEIFTLKGFRCKLAKISDRPPMRERRDNLRLAKALAGIAEKWEIPFGQESSLRPSAAGLVPARVPVVCGIGPACKDLYTPQEAVNRVSLIQRTLLVAQYLAQEVKR
ncbi:ATP-grasp domain-containing protein [Thermodesulfobacteriota bacterium]